MKIEFSPEQREAHKLNAGAESLKSPKHENQDRVLVDVEHGAFGVFDGLGGYRGAEVAAALARDIVQTRLAALPTDASLETTRDAVVTALRAADQAIKIKARENSSLSRMCTTATVLKVWKSTGGKRSLIIGNVGDSHVYYLNADGNFSHITGGGDELDQALGDSYSALAPHVFTIDLVRTGDKALICSDGVYRPLTEVILKEILDNERSPEIAAQKLASKAQERAAEDPYMHGGPPDDASVIVVRL